MKGRLDRRSFSKAIALGLGAAAVPALRAAEGKLKIGHTCITWGTSPSNPERIATLEAALKDIAAVGYWGFETYPEVLEAWDAKGALKGLIDRYGVPLTSAYFRINVAEPSAQKENLTQVIRLGKVVKAFGGNFGAIQVSGIKRQDYNFAAHRSNIAASLNECAMALNDLGLGAGLHQHTGTAIETQEEVYAIMETVNTKYVKFAPDVAQLQRGGADAAKVVKDFLPLVLHMHVKDWDGKRYCPLGQGQVQIAAILDMVEAANKQPNLMVELDSPKPLTALESAQVTRAFLEKLGYKFKS